MRLQGVLPALDAVVGDDTYGDEERDGAYLLSQLQVSVQSDLISHRRGNGDELVIQHSFGSGLYSYSQLAAESRFARYKGKNMLACARGGVR